MNLQKTLDSLQPYVIGIRYIDNHVIVDVVFKEDWTILEDTKIKKVKGNEDMNYYMLFSEVEGIGLDDLLAYVDKIIKVNMDREKKHELLVKKVNELKELFKKNTLTKLTTLKFSFGEENLVGNITELDEISEPVVQSSIEEEPPIEEDIEESVIIKHPIIPKAPPVYLDENKQPIPLSEEDKEILEEEARAEKNRQIIEARKNKTVIKSLGKVELPPKKVMTQTLTAPDCECGPEEACSKCIDRKGY